MAVTKTLTLWEFEREFRDFGRDNFSKEGYRYLYDMLDEADVELDVIAVCCEWTEESVGDLWEDYGHLVGGGEFADEAFQALVEALADETMVVPLGNGGYLVACF